MRHPAFPQVDDSFFAVRRGDAVNFDLPMATDQAPGRTGYAYGTGGSTLLRDAR